MVDPPGDCGNTESPLVLHTTPIRSIVQYNSTPHSPPKIVSLISLSNWRRCILYNAVLDQHLILYISQKIQSCKLIGPQKLRKPCRNIPSIQYCRASLNGLNKRYFDPSNCTNESTATQIKNFSPVTEHGLLM